MQFYRVCLGLASVASLLVSCDSNTTPTSPRAVTPQHALNDEGDDDHVVVGTGDPAIDVPAVQVAVDQGGTVVLKGHFSFGAPPTKPVAPALTAAPRAAEVRVSRAVRIIGADAGGAMPTIDGGTIPFYVEARDSAVTIRGLRFVRPIFSAVLVDAVDGLEIASNRIEGLQPFAGLGEAISVITTTKVPTPPAQGSPGNVSGRLSIVRNFIDAIGGTSKDNTLGITVFSAGDSASEVEVQVSENTIKNTTEPAINFRRIVGRAYITHNVVATGSLSGATAGNQAIRAVNLGTYVIAHNSIRCEWAAPDAEGIGVFSQFASWAIEHAVVEDNDVTMAAPSGTGFTAFSAGIGVYGFANSNVVQNNTIRGSALAGLSIPVFPLSPTAPASPTDNEFIRNRFVDFTPTVADIFVGPHALGTRIIGPGTVVDLGDGTTRR
jgi:hypothetical protein